MRKYTVVVKRPGYIEEQIGSGVDVYLAFTEAETPQEAAKLGQLEIFKADKKDELEPEAVEDYEVAIVFEGHIEPVLWGWQL